LPREAHLSEFGVKIEWALWKRGIFRGAIRIDDVHANVRRRFCCADFWTKSCPIAPQSSCGAGVFSFDGPYRASCKTPSRWHGGVYDGAGLSQRAGRLEIVSKRSLKIPRPPRAQVCETIIAAPIQVIAGMI
jgi:hypothetical protein